MSFRLISQSTNVWPKNAILLQNYRHSTMTSCCLLTIIRALIVHRTIKLQVVSTFSYRHTLALPLRFIPRTKKYVHYLITSKVQLSLFTLLKWLVIVFKNHCQMRLPQSVEDWAADPRFWKWILILAKNLVQSTTHSLASHPQRQDGICLSSTVTKSLKSLKRAILNIITLWH